MGQSPAMPRWPGARPAELVACAGAILPQACWCAAKTAASAITPVSAVRVLCCPVRMASTCHATEVGQWTDMSSTSTHTIILTCLKRLHAGYSVMVQGLRRAKPRGRSSPARSSGDNEQACSQAGRCLLRQQASLPDKVVVGCQT